MLELEPVPADIASAQAPPTTPARNRALWRRRLSALGAALLALLTKAKAILLLLGNIKIFATAGTMVVSVLAYGTIWGIPFATGFVVLLLIHELGHVIALRRE